MGAGFYPRPPYNPAMPMRATSLRPSLLCLLLASGSLSSSRAPAQTLPDKSTGPYVAPGEVVSVTNLDVVVTDGKGNRVTGLKKEDFIVIEDKLEQTVKRLAPGRPLDEHA